MIYVTGDTHGDLSRFSPKEMKVLNSGDTLIVCGDFGFIWNGTKKENAVLDKLSRLKYTIAFADGCHENYDILGKLPVTEWCGGKVQMIRDNIIHLMRGQYYTAGGVTFFVFGGGHSQDYDFRGPGSMWWPAEQPSDEEITEGLHNIQVHDNKVDYIITHEPPAALKDCLGVDIFQRTQLHSFFDELIRITEFKKWYFGKCHIDKHIPISFEAVFNRVIPLE